MQPAHLGLEKLFRMQVQASLGSQVAYLRFRSIDSEGPGRGLLTQGYFMCTQDERGVRCPPLLF